jgi:hypothetical protein
MLSMTAGDEHPVSMAAATSAEPATVILPQRQGFAIGPITHSIEN